MPSEEDLYIAWTKKLIAEFLYYTCLTLTPTGLVLNALQIAVFARKRFKNCNTGFYFMLLGVFNSFALINIFVTFYGTSIGHDITLISSTSCLVVMYLVRVIPQIPSWLEVLLTYDRLVFVLQIKRLDFLKQKRVICLLLVLVVIMLSVVNFANLEFFVAETDTYSNVTLEGSNQTVLVKTASYLCTSYKEVVLMRDVLAIMIRTAIPFILIIGANVKLVKTLFESRKKVFRAESSSLSTSEPSNFAIMRREHSFLVSIIALDLFFVTSLIPLAVTLIILDFYSFIPSLASPTRVATARLVYYITFYISTMPYALGFAVNIGFNRVFRNEVYQMVSEFKAFLSKSDDFRA